MIRTTLISISVLMLASTGCIARSSNDEKAKSEKSTSSETIKYANDMNSFKELISGDKPVLVDFYADWCAPCRMMGPILEQVAKDIPNDVKVVKVNVDKNGEAAQLYGVRSIPTLILFQNGQVKWQGVGVMQADQIKQIVKTKAL